MTRDEMLAADWAAGYVTLEIARRLTAAFRVQVTKNAVVGRARRLGLPPRPSPLKNGRPRKKAAPVAAPPPAAPAGPITTASAPVQKPGPQPRPVRPLAAFAGRVTACQHLTGERRRYVACGAPTLPGKSWCAEHHALLCIAPGALPRGIHA